MSSRLFRAANKFHIGTPPVNESFGHYLAVRLLQEVLEAIYTSIMVDFKGNIPIPMLNALHTDSKEVSIRNSASKTKTLAELLTNKFDRIEINFRWIPGSLNPADIASKGMEKPVAVCNSALWRKGPTLFKNMCGLKNSTYGKVTK